MSQISVNNLTFYYDGSYDNLFEDVSFIVDSDWKLGFIGRNGRGKTTFLNLLMGKYEYRGNISSNVTFDYFPFVIPEITKEMNTIDVIELLDKNYELWKVCLELTQLKLDTEVLYRPYSTLSYGEQTKIMLAVLFAKDNNFLLIDEPTNHLDKEARELIKDYLSKKKGYILVSHDRWFLDSCIDHVLVINKNNIEVEQGNFSSWFENKTRQDEYEMSENERLKKDIRRLEEAASRTKSWSDKVEKSKIGSHAADRGYIGHKAAKMMKRAKNVENRVTEAMEEKSKLLKNIDSMDTLKIIPQRHYKDVLINAKDLSIHYGDRIIFNNLDFSIQNGDRFVIEGGNGSGKSSLIKKILGEEIVTTGELMMASGLKISYVSQDTSFLKGKLEEYIESNHLEESLFKALLRKLDFERVQFEKNMEDYSGGQKKKVLIAKSLCEQAHLYIWDEPLNFIDIFSRMQLEQLLLHFKPTMILVEHDKMFIDKVATKRIHLKY